MVGERATKVTSEGAVTNAALMSTGAPSAVTVKAVFGGATRLGNSSLNSKTSWEPDRPTCANTNTGGTTSSVVALAVLEAWPGPTALIALTR